MSSTRKDAETLDDLLGEDDTKYLTIRKVPTDVSLIIHGIYYQTVPDKYTGLNEVVNEQFATAYKVKVTSAKFLKTEPKTTTPVKKATSIIVHISEEEAKRFEPRFLFLGKYKEAKVMWHATPTTHCTRCWKYGHPRVGCKETSDTCPVCYRSVQ